MGFADGSRNLPLLVRGREIDASAAASTHPENYEMFPVEGRETICTLQKLRVF